MAGISWPAASCSNISVIISLGFAQSLQSNGRLIYLVDRFVAEGNSEPSTEVGILEADNVAAGAGPVKTIFKSSSSEFSIAKCNSCSISVLILVFVFAMTSTSYVIIYRTLRHLLLIATPSAAILSHSAVTVPPSSPGAFDKSFLYYIYLINCYCKIY